MNPLEQQKRLLIAESELNRSQMIGDMAALKDDLRTLTGRAKSYSLLASSAAVLVAGLAARRRGKSGDAAAKPSWPQTLLKGASLVSTLWLALRKQRPDQGPDSPLKK